MAAVVVTGVRELDLALQQFAPRLQRKIERRAVRAAGKLLLDDAKANASRISPRIAKLLTLRAMKRRRGVVGVTVKTTRTAVTEDGTVLNPHWFEFGAPGHLAWGKSAAPLEERPFVRPAMEKNRAPVRAMFQTTIAALIQETAAEVRKN